jgi:hypothetical protein
MLFICNININIKLVTRVSLKHRPLLSYSPDRIVRCKPTGFPNLLPIARNVQVFRICCVVADKLMV